MVRHAEQAHATRTNMTPRSKSLQTLALFLLCLTAFAPLVNAAPPDHWVGTWGAAPVAALNPDGKILAGDTTLREIVHISIGGPMARVVLSNEFRLHPLTITAAHIALTSRAGR